MSPAVAWIGVPKPAHEITDSFTIGGTADLSTHTTDQGYTWTNWTPGSGTSTMNDDSSGVAIPVPATPTNNHAELYYTSHTMSVADYTASVSVTATSTAAAEACLGIRFSYGGSSAVTGYFVKWRPDINTASLYKINGGFPATQLGSDLSVSGLGPHTLAITANGTTISATFDGTSIASVTDSAISQKGTAAIGGGLRDSQVANGTIKYDTLVVN